MDMLVSLVDSLKLNNTLYMQFLIFLVGFSFLYYVMFKPYNKAAQTRYDRTIGNEDSADKYDEEIELLQRKYGQCVKETNESIALIFSDSHDRLKKEVSTLMLEAQKVYKSKKEQKEKSIMADYEKEREKLPGLSVEIKKQLKKVLAGA